MYLRKLSVATLLAASALSQTAQADMAFGLGVSYIFGQGVAVSAKAFTNDQEDEAAGSFGIDYLPATGSWRPNVGVSYLGNNVYGDINFGYDYQGSNWNFGVGAGGVNTEEDTVKKPVKLP